MSQPPKYLLRRRALGPQPVLEIDGERYDLLVQARSSLISANHIEQRYEMVLANFLELESAISSWALRLNIQTDYSYSAFSRLMLEANLRIGNLLASSRAYIDQVPQDFSDAGDSGWFHDLARQEFRSAFERSQSYRFLEALRNFVQHRGMPVHRVAPALRRGDRAPWKGELKVLCLREHLEDAGTFKSAVLAELPEEVDLHAAVREYMSELSVAHVALRSAVTPLVSTARALFQRAIDDYRDCLDGGSAIGLAACQEVSGELKGWVPVFLEWDDVRLQLAEKNKYPIGR